MIVPIVGFFATGRMVEKLDARPFLAIAIIALLVQIRSIQLVAGFRVGGWLVGWAMLTQMPFFEPTDWAGIFLLALITAAIYGAAFFLGLLFGRFLRSRAERSMYE